MGTFKKNIFLIMKILLFFVVEMVLGLTPWQIKWRERQRLKRQNLQNLLRNGQNQNQKRFKCWECNAQNPDQCNETGKQVTCQVGQVCSVEYRKRDGVESQLTIGCKQEQACNTQHVMNFNDPYPNQKQCQFARTDYGSSSVCRQCCSSENHSCFSAYGFIARGGAIEWNQFDQSLWETTLQ